MINKDNLGVSLYRQIVEGLISSIQEGQLATGDPIPSLNALKDRHQVSRDTVLMAYNELKTRGIIDSKPGKGYYIRSTNIEVQKKVFLLLDENSAYKSTLYKSFLGHCEGEAQVEVFFHHQNPVLFKTLLQTYAGRFSHYVIIPVPEKDCLEMLEELTKKGKVFILDYGFNGEQLRFNSVYQEFEQDIYELLLANQSSFKAYEETIMVIGKPSGSTQNAHAPRIINGYRKFANKTGSKVRIERSLPDEIRKGCCYILHSDPDLVELVRTVQREGLEPGKDIGIISFNETPLKSVVDKGISTISTDHPEMGKLMAAMVSGELKGHIRNKFRMIRRKSF